MKGKGGKQTNSKPPKEVAKGGGKKGGMKGGY